MSMDLHMDMDMDMDMDGDGEDKGTWTWLEPIFTGGFLLLLAGGGRCVLSDVLCLDYMLIVLRTPACLSGRLLTGDMIVFLFPVFEANELK